MLESQEPGSNSGILGNSSWGKVGSGQANLYIMLKIA